ncbi:MAG TPA: cytochrome c oxidase assembly protein [Longimicrobium sp.]|nr:cytochrome c oxidase assembly protein [Longimicrobium sp.]
MPRIHPASSAPPSARACAWLLAAWAALAPGRLLAHPGIPPAPHDLWRSWGLEPTVVVPLFLTAWLYSRGVETVWRRAGRGRGVTPGQAAAFAGGMTALFVALVSPVDRVAESLFWVHMVQHLLLIAVAPPLLVLGAPQAGLAWGLPRNARRGMGRWWHRRTWLRAALRWMAAPLPAVALHSVALWAWHVPVAYEAAVARPAVHAAEHLSFVGTALLFWWAVLHRRGSLTRVPGLAMLALFAVSMESGALGALLTFSASPWYRSHLATAPAWGITAIDDQQIAGLVMWIPGSLAYLAAVAWIFVRWMSSAHQTEILTESR